MNKLDLNKPLQTVDGRPVELISTKGRGAYPLVGYIGATTNLFHWNNNGVGLYLSDIHIINVPEPVPYRPWTTNDCPLGICVKPKGIPFPKVRAVIVEVNRTHVFIGVSQTAVSFQELFEHWTKLDGSPCGVKQN